MEDLTDQEVAESYYEAVEDSRLSDAALYAQEARARGMIL